MYRGHRRFTSVALAVVLAVAVGACGSSKSSGTSNSSSASSSTPASSGSSPASSGSSASAVSSATAAIAPYSSKPTPFPVTVPLKTRPTGDTIAYLQCTTPVCGVFAQLLAPTPKLLGYKKLLTVDTGSTVGSLQSAMSSIVAAKPAGALLTAIRPDQFLTQIKQAVAAKISMTTNGVMNPLQYGFGAADFDQRLTTLAGKLLADWVISHDGNKASSVLYTVPQLDFTSVIQKGYAAEMARLCPGCSVRYVAIPVSAVGTTAPDQVVADLQAHPSTKVAVFASEETVSGVPAALKSASLSPQITGFAPDPVAVQYIKNGQVTGGLGLDIGVMIYEQLDELARLITHQSLTPAESAGAVPIEFLTSKNLPANVSQGWSAYPDFVQRFAKIWSGQ